MRIQLPAFIHKHRSDRSINFRIGRSPGFVIFTIPFIHFIPVHIQEYFITGSRIDSQRLVHPDRIHGSSFFVTDHRFVFHFGILVGIKGCQSFVDFLHFIFIVCQIEENIPVQFPFDIPEYRTF